MSKPVDHPTTPDLDVAELCPDGHYRTARQRAARAVLMACADIIIEGAAKLAAERATTEGEAA